MQSVRVKRHVSREELARSARVGGVVQTEPEGAVHAAASRGNCRANLFERERLITERELVRDRASLLRALHALPPFPDEGLRLVVVYGGVVAVALAVVATPRFVRSVAPRPPTHLRFRTPTLRALQGRGPGKCSLSAEANTGSERIEDAHRPRASISLALRIDPTRTVVVAKYSFRGRIRRLASRRTYLSATGRRSSPTRRAPPPSSTASSITPMSS